MSEPYEVLIPEFFVPYTQQLGRPPTANDLEAHERDKAAICFARNFATALASGHWPGVDWRLLQCVNADVPDPLDVGMDRMLNARMARLERENAELGARCHAHAVRIYELERTVVEASKAFDSPQTTDFLDAVRNEAAHQVSRWSAAHDDGKMPQDWFWLLGYLAGKALQSATTFNVTGKREDLDKAMHHTISSAAALMNWHAHMRGDADGFRPGITEPKA